MRIAFIACSAYSACQKLTELANVDSDVDLLEQRLAEPDAGFVVHSFRAERGLVEAVEQVLSEASAPVDELLFYFSGYAVLNDERGPALLLDGERLATFSLKRLKRVLTERARSSLAVLDTLPAFDGQLSPKDAVSVIGSALADPSSHVHLLASNRPESEAHGRSPFASLFELVLDWQSVSGSPVGVDNLYAAMRAEEALFAEVRAAEYFRGTGSFELLRPSPTPMWSEPPSFTQQSAVSSEVPLSAAVPLVAGAPAPASSAVPLVAGAPAPASSAVPLVAGAPAPASSAVPLVAGAPAPAPSAVPLVAGAPAPASSAVPLVAGAPAPAPSTAEGLVNSDEASEVTPPRPIVRDVSGIQSVPSIEPTPKKAGPPPLPKMKPTAAEPPTVPPTPEALRAVALERMTECMADGRHADAAIHARTALSFAPRDTETYRTLSMLFEKLGRPDGAWNVACVLDACGAADVNESLLAGLHRPDGLIAAKGVLAEEDWKKRLLYPERDPALDALFYALGSAVVEVGAETAQRKRRIPTLDPTTQQDPTKSTTTLARTLVWSARLLGIPAPALYVVDDIAAGEIAIAPTVAAAALASKSLGSGLELPELAFLWARRLVSLRPEHRLAALLPNAAELEDFMQAARVLGAGSERSFKRLEGDTKLFARGLKRHLRGVNLAPLEVAAKAMGRDSIGPFVLGYRRSLELSAGRAGLLASGDLALAFRMTERFPQHGALSLDEQRTDLLTYAVSDEYAALRERLGVTVRA